MPVNDYDNTSFPALAPVDFSPWNFTCLNVNGYNAMKVPIKGISGTALDPCLTSIEFTRSGPYFETENSMTISLFGYPSFRFNWSSVDLIDTYGRTGKLQMNITADRVWSLPDETGTIQVKTDTVGEVPTPATDGSTTTFTLSHHALYIIDLQYNGLGGNSYTFTTGSNTFSVSPAPLATDSLKVIYIRI